MVLSVVEYVQPTREKIEIEFPIGRKGEMKAFTLICLPKGRVSSFKKDNNRFAVTTAEVQSRRFPEGYVILTEAKEIIPFVVPKEAGSTFKRHEHLFDSIYITDQYLEHPEL